MSSISAISSSTGFWNSIGQGLQSGAKEIKEDATAFGDAISSAYTSVEETVESAATSVESAASSVSEALSDGGAAIREAWETLGETIDTYI